MGGSYESMIEHDTNSTFLQLVILFSSNPRKWIESTTYGTLWQDVLSIVIIQFDITTVRRSVTARYDIYTGITSPTLKKCSRSAHQQNPLTTEIRCI